MPDWEREIRSRLAMLRLDPNRESAIVEELSRAPFVEAAAASSQAPLGPGGTAPIPGLDAGGTNTGGVGWETRKWTVFLPISTGTSQWLLDESLRMSTSSDE